MNSLMFIVTRMVCTILTNAALGKSSDQPRSRGLFALFKLESRRMGLLLPEPIRRKTKLSNCEFT